MNITFEERHEILETISMHIGNALTDAGLDIGETRFSHDELAELTAAGILNALHNHERVYDWTAEEAERYADHVVHEMRNLSEIDG